MFSAGSSANADPADLTKQPITYRHLLSPQTFNVYNPLRVVALIDSDAFYAACEQVRLGLSPDVPIAVQQWQGLIAINYPARKYGISRMESITEAKKKCPELVAVHVATYKEGEREAGYWPDAKPTTHKVSLDHYRRESKKVLNVFQEVLPNAEIEKASIDEAFFDLTAPVRDTILSRYPYLAQVPVDAPQGLDTPLPQPPPVSWAGLGNILPITLPLSEGETSNPEGTEKTPFALDPSAKGKQKEVEEEQEETWGDLALAIGAEFVNDVRNAVYKQLGYTTSAGIARNKTMAKLCASCKKPFGQTILRDAAIPAFLHPMPFQKIRFLGGKLGDAIAKEYDAKTIGDLLTVSREDMQKQFGEESFWIYNILRGNDYSEVKGRLASKSMLASKNIQPTLKKVEDGLHWLKVLSSELAIRLAEARDVTPTIWPKTIVLHIRQGFTAPRSRQSPFPFVNALTDETIFKAAEKLWRELLGASGRTGEVSNIALGFSGLGALEQGQKSIEGFLGNGSERPPAKRRRESEPDERKDPVPEDKIKAGRSQDQRAFICPRCSKALSAADDAQLAALRAEHDDFHFAHDLQETDRQADQAAPRPKPPVTKKRKKADGIAGYFQRV